MSLTGSRPDPWSRSFEASVEDPRLRFEMWTLFLGKRHGLSLVDVWGRYGEAGSGLSEKRRRELWRDPQWRAWTDEVLSIKVDVHRNGRLLAEEPDSTFAVEIRWRDSHGIPVATRVTIMPHDYLPWNEPLDLDAYMMACRLELSRLPERLVRLPANRPELGNKHDPRFYRQLLQRYDSLLEKGHKAPVQQIARDMNANPSTVKSWLRRGRKHLKEGDN